MSDTMQGQRNDDAELLDIAPGGYAKLPSGDWFLCAPNGVFGTISPHIHTITEHDDGTITVSPSILYHPDANDAHGWHGFLERGIWRTA